MTDLEMTIAWVKAHHEAARERLLAGKTKDERGATAVEWLLIIIAAVGICAAVTLAVKTYVDSQSAKLNG
jgi:Flp pilus assembly pilin Flp